MRRINRNPQPNPYLTTEEFASYIGVTSRTVRIWDDKGLLPCHHKTPRGQRLYSRDQVREYLKDPNFKFEDEK